MDATWADGQVTREYTLLLDPPLTADRKPPAIDIPARAPTPAPEAAATAAAPSKAPAPVYVPDPAPSKPRAPVAPDTDEIRVKDGDTLWSLASAVRPEGATVYQTMNALYRENPSAYGGNINNMYKGAILRVPPADEIRALDGAASERMLAEHTRAWQTGTPVSSGSGETSAAEAAEKTSAGETATESAPAADAADAATLRLASAGESAAPASAGDGEEAAPATAAVSATEGDGRDTELLLAREEAASAKQEVANLRDRLVDMEERLMDAQRLLELKDEQLARLQAYYGREDAGTPAPAMIETTEPEEQAIAPVTLAADEQPLESASATEALPPWRKALSGEVDAAAVGRLSSEEDTAEAAVPAADTVSAPEAVPAAGAAASTAAVPAWRRALSGAVEGGPVVAAEDAEGVSEREASAAETSDSATTDSAPAVVAETEPAVAMAEPAAEPAAPVETMEAAPAVATGDAVPAAETQAATQTEPAAAVEPAPEPGDATTSRFLPDELDGLPVLPVLGGVAVAGLLGLVFLARRRDREDEPGPQATTATAAAATLREEEANLEAGLALLDEKMAGHEWDDAQKTAESLLASSPEHPALNLRMLEILFARGDKDAFMGLAGKLAGSGFGADHPLFWSQVESMGQKLAPGDTLFSPQRGAVVDRRTPEGEDLDGMLNTLESHLDRGDETLRGEAAEVLGEAAEELGTAAVLGGEDAVEFDPEIAAERASATGDPSLQEPPEDAVEFETVATLGDAGSEPIEPPVLEDTLEFDLDSLGTEPAPDAGAPPEGENVVTMKQAEPVGEVVSEEDVETKLDLARAFLDLGDTEGARSILEEVVSEGNDRQREEASNLLQNTA
jgi:pilus assembly protein FimV